jgi:type VI secretion system protein ImpB
MPELAGRREMRSRAQRVHILCEVHVGDAVEKVDLPFVVGVMADLSGQRDKPLPELAAREFTDVDAKNFNDFLADQAPRLTFSVPNKMGNPDQKMAVELSFRHMDDFSPDKVAQQIEPLAKLLELRDSLKEIRDRAKSKGKLATLLDEVLANSEKRAALGKELGIDPSAPPSSQS